MPYPGFCLQAVPNGDDEGSFSAYATESSWEGKSHTARHQHASVNNADIIGHACDLLPTFALRLS